MVVAEVGLAEMLWTAIWVFFLVLFVWIFIAVVSDLFRDRSLSGWAKAAWVVGLIVFPLLGPLAYLIVRGRGMTERTVASEQAARAEMDSYIRSTAASTGTAPVDDLTRLAELRDNGTIDDREFTTLKSRIVGRGATGTAGAAPA